MSTKLLRELDTYQSTLEVTRRRFASDGKITREEQDRLDAIQKKIDLIVNALAAEGGAIVVEGSKPSAAKPPQRPSNSNYQGIPLEKLPRDYQKNRAREGARRVRQGVNTLSSWSEHLSNEISEQNAQLQKYEATVGNKLGVEEAFAKDLKSGKIRQLRNKAGDAFNERLEQYEEASSEIKRNTKLLEAQVWRVAAAKSMVAQAEALIESYQQEKNLANEKKKLAETKEKLEKVKNFIGLYKEAAQDPAGTAKKLGIKIANDLIDKLMVEFMTGGGYERQIKEIEARIASINKKLDELKLDTLKGYLNESVSTVKAEQEQTLAIREALEQAKRKQGQVVDALADIEKNHPGTTTVFGQLKQYYAGVQDAGFDTLQSSRELESAIKGAERAMPYTKAVREAVLQDSSDMRTLYDGDWANPAVLEQDEQAKSLVEYTRQLDDWYKSQQVDKKLVEQHQLQAKLLRNEQFRYIGDMVNRVQHEGLGHKQRDSKITR